MARGRSSKVLHHQRASDRPRRRSRSREFSPPASARQFSLQDRHLQRGRSPSGAAPKELFPNLHSSSTQRSGTHPSNHESSQHRRSEDREGTHASRRSEHQHRSSRKDYHSSVRSHHESKHRKHRPSLSPLSARHNKEHRDRSRSHNRGERRGRAEGDWEHSRPSITSPRRSSHSAKRSFGEQGQEDRFADSKTSRKRSRSRSPSVARDFKSSKHHHKHHHSYKDESEGIERHQKRRDIGEADFGRSQVLDKREDPETQRHRHRSGSRERRDNLTTEGRHRSPISHHHRGDREEEIKRLSRTGSIASEHSQLREQASARYNRGSQSPKSRPSNHHPRSSEFQHTGPPSRQVSGSPGRGVHPSRVALIEDQELREQSRPRASRRESLTRRRHRSRSRSVHSAGSRTNSPDMYNEYLAKGRQYSAGHHQYSRSPPHHHHSSGPGYRGDYNRGGGRHSHGSPPFRSRQGQHSPPPSGHNQAQSPYFSQNQHPVNHASATHRGRGSSALGAPPPRGHFQNLSWTPDKGSRGGIAPSERRLPPPQNSMDETGASAPDVQSDNVHDEHSKDEHGGNDLEANKTREERPIPSGPRNARPESTDASMQGHGEPSKMPPPSKPSIKFEMKVPTAPALAKRSNVIQAVPKAPSRPSVFQTAAAAPEDRSRRADPPSPRGKQPPPRFAGSRYDDHPSQRRPPFAESIRHERGSYKLDRHDPYPPPSIRDRRSFDTREPDIRSRGPQRPARDIPKSLKSSKPRRKRFKKVLKRHVRIALPPRTLPKAWARSDFVYYPRPDRHSVVGAGTYGKVFKAHNVYLNHCVALKTLPLIKPRRKASTRDYVSRDKKRKRQERWVKDGLHLTSLREIKLLKSISHQHENVVGIREIFLEGPSCNLVFDYFEFDMHGIIYSAKVGLEDSMTKDLVRQVFQGLDFLHTKAHILHRDIKAANILVGANGQVRITDFGLAKQVKTAAELDSQPWYKKKFEHSNRVITTPYRPPELLLGATLYGGEVDVWSGGCVLFEAFLKKLPFQGTGEDVDHLLTIWKVLGLPNVSQYPEVVDLEWYWLFMTRVQPKKSIFGRLYKSKVSPHLYHLLRCIFQHDPKKRPTAAQVLQHPFFTTEAPLPKSAGSFLKTVDGEWHELEYKMIRDKEKAATRRKHENNVILGYLKHKQGDHEKKLLDSVLDSETLNHQQRVEFYKAEQESFKQRVEVKPTDEEDDADHTKQVAEMKKTHGDMYMNAARRGRYRGPTREKVDEKLLQEAWKWYEEENKKGNNPVPSIMDKVSGDATKKSASTLATPTKPQDSSKSLLRNALLGSKAALDPTPDVYQARADKKHDYEAKMKKYVRLTALYEESKARQHANRIVSEKRSAGSPLVDQRDSKKMRDDDT